MLQIAIKTHNAAYSDDGKTLSIDGRVEISKNLRQIATKIEGWEDSGAIIDINGNVVGKWRID